MMLLCDKGLFSACRDVEALLFRVKIGQRFHVKIGHPVSRSDKTPLLG